MGRSTVTLVISTVKLVIEERTMYGVASGKRLRALGRVKAKDERIFVFYVVDGECTVREVYVECKDGSFLFLLPCSVLLYPENGNLHSKVYIPYVRRFLTCTRDTHAARLLKYCFGFCPDVCSGVCPGSFSGFALDST